MTSSCGIYKRPVEQFNFKISQFQKLKSGSWNQEIVKSWNHEIMKFGSEIVKSWNQEIVKLWSFEEKSLNRDIMASSNFEEKSWIFEIVKSWREIVKSWISKFHNFMITRVLLKISRFMASFMLQYPVKLYSLHY